MAKKKNGKVMIPSPPKENASLDTKLRYIEKLNEAKKKADQKRKEEAERKALSLKIKKLFEEIRKNPLIGVSKKKRK